MAQNKNNHMRRTPSLESESKKQDQALRGAGGAPETSLPPKQGKNARRKANDTFNTSNLKKGLNRIGGKKNPIGNLLPPKSDGLGPIKNKAGKAAKPAEKKNASAAKPQERSAEQKKKQQNNQSKDKNQNRNSMNKNNKQQIKPAVGRISPPKKSTPGATSGASVKAYFLGGLNEIGKNFTVFECEGDMIIVDCGMSFPNDDMLGIDIVIPDFTFVEDNFEKIRAIVITHGHEDHIGGLPFLLKKIKVPVYGTALAMGLLEHKLEEHGVRADIRVTPPGSRFKAGYFDVETIRVNHSISDAVALAIRTPAGILVHTGDFKIDFTPEDGKVIDLARFAEIGSEGVLALFADSTNAEREGYTQTEQRVNESLDTLFSKAEGKRIIVATFASSISRVQQIINCAVKHRRKVALSGRSMLNMMGIASKLGYLSVPDGILIDIGMINRYASGEIVLITTGSQGEPMSALTRMAFADHRQVAVGPEDVIIISARPIPGNEKTVGTVVDELLKKGCQVVYESMYEVHVSGHACQEELKIMQNLVKPKYFIPVHGEQKHLRKHAGLAMSMGVPEKNIFIGDIGSAIELSEARIKELPEVIAGSVMVDGLGVGDVGNVVLRDRKHLSEDGIMIIVSTLEPRIAQIASGPDIVSRGFVYVKESEILMDEARKLVYNIIQDNLKRKVYDHNTIKLEIRDELSSLMYKRTKRRPMIVPILMDVS